MTGDPENNIPQLINTPVTAEGNTYLHELCLKNAPVEQVCEAVLKHGAHTEVLNKKFISPLGIAIINNNLEMIQCLIDLGAKLYFHAGQGKNFNALAVAISAGHADALNLLIKNGGGLYVNEPAWPQGEAPSVKVTSSWSKMTVTVEKEILPCLSHAVRENRPGLIEILADAGAFLNREAGKENQTPLLLAVARNDIVMVEKLVNAGAEIDQLQSSSGMNALHHALAADKSDMVARLLKLGADPNATTADGQTPLLLCAGKPNEPSALASTQRLLEAKADVNCKSMGDNKDTALHRAATRGNSRVIDALLNGGADPLLTDAFNKTAAHYARDKKLTGIAGKLEEAEGIAEQKLFEKAYDKLNKPKPPQ